MKINVLHLIEGAKQARGLTVIIDVFRAFSLECYLHSFGVKELRPVGSIEETFAFRDTLPSCVLIGERGGKKYEGCDFGNSPSTVPPEAVCGKTVIHTTSAGTQGIVNAVNASEIITGSLVNAEAVAKYILSKAPEEVSLVAMGDSGLKPTKEDELCAEYISALLTGEGMSDIDERIARLRYDGGEKFFNPETQHIFPSADFEMCTRRDIFPYVLRVEKDEAGYISRRVDVWE